MEIVSGKISGMALFSPHTDAVRPTSVRARRAFFDSLGDLTGKVFADLCAGSGAMGLEAASRGAEQVIFAEYAKESLRTIEKNCRKAKEHGLDAELTVIPGRIPESAAKLARESKPDILFADPPYAVSAELLDQLTQNDAFTVWAENGELYWELPEGGTALRPPKAPWKITSIRNLGPTRFMVLTVSKE